MTNQLLVTQDKCAEAELLYERFQVIQETFLGPDHPSVAATLNIRAGLLWEQVRNDARRLELQ